MDSLDQELDMKTIFLIFIISFLIPGLLFSEPSEKNDDQSPVPEKYQLIEDRKKIDELRKDIPAEKKQENDELALTLNWMNQHRLSPGDIRGRFSQTVAKKRRLFNSELTKIRQDFSSKEKEARREFDKLLKDERQKVTLQKKIDSKVKKQQMDELEIKRRDFNASQKQERDSFEEEIRDKRKSFDEYIKSKQDEFNQDLKQYTNEYNDKKKLEKEKISEKNKQDTQADMIKKVQLESGQ